MRNTTISRRQFLVAGSTVTGSLVTGLPVFDIARADLTEGTLGERQVGYFVEITPAGKIIIGSNQPEIGQGLRTALPMMVAEEGDGSDEAPSGLLEMLESLLRPTDACVGSYTSPHILRFNERICVDGRDASDAEIVAALEQVEAARDDEALTYFEFGTLAAMVVFAEAGADTLLLEIGLVAPTLLPQAAPPR